MKILILLMAASCTPESVQFSEVPALTMEKAPVQYQRNGLDSSVVLELNYTDGDGDIGLESADTNAPYQFGGKFFYNLFVGVYKIENGISSPILIPSTPDSIMFNDRITTLTPTGKNKSIYGKITINLSAVPYPGIKPDSMYYTVQIADRKLHLSNLIKTPVMRFQF